MGFFDKLELKRELKGLMRNAVGIDVAMATGLSVGASKIGGKPDLPRDFQWPCFSARVRGKELSLPLAFVAQVNLEEASQFDGERILPGKGLLSFFYELETQRSGMDSADKGCAHVFYFEDISVLQPTALPDTMPDSGLIPEQKIGFSSFMDVPCWEEFSAFSEREFNDELYRDVRSELLPDCERHECKLLGYADIIQDAMQRDCQLVSLGYDLAGGPVSLSPEQKDEVLSASRDWILLFQSGTIATDDFELMFGDMGRIYFYIRRQDLAALKFENAVMMMQC